MILALSSALDALDLDALDLAPLDAQALAWTPGTWTAADLAAALSPCDADALQAVAFLDLEAVDPVALQAARLALA